MLADKFDRSKLSNYRTTVEKLSDWLGIGKGTVDLIIHYAEDMAHSLETGILQWTWIQL